jgi:hypothetical protein
MFKVYDNVVKKGHSFLELSQYLTLFDPVIDWLFQCLGYQADRKLFGDVWAIYTNSPKHPAFLRGIIRYFPSDIISVTVGIMIGTIRTDYEERSDD